MQSRNSAASTPRRDAGTGSTKSGYALTVGSVHDADASTRSEMAWPIDVTRSSAISDTTIIAKPSSIVLRRPMRVPMIPAGSAPITPPTAHAIMPVVASSGATPNRSMPCSELAHRLLQLRRSQIAGGRIDEVAPQPDGVDGRGGAREVGTGRKLQPGARRPFAVGALVAPEAVGAEAPGDRRQLAVLDAAGQVIGSARKYAGKQAHRQLRLVHRVALARRTEPEDHTGKAAVAGGQEQMLPAFSLEAVGLNPRPLRLAEAGATRPFGIAGDPDRDRRPLAVGGQQHGCDIGGSGVFACWHRRFVKTVVVAAHYRQRWGA